MKSPAYYRDNPGNAWYDGFTNYLCQEIIGPEVYQVHEVYLPKSLKPTIKKLKKHFSKFHNNGIPYDFRRRKTPCEFVEFALNLLKKLDISRKGVALGSSFISPVPWATFGSKEMFARNQFDDIGDLAEHYKGYFRGGHYALEVHLSNINIAKSLGKKHNMTANLIIAIALLILTDILINCGPDCIEIFDAFTNDYRDGDRKVIEKWKNNVYPVVAHTKSALYREYPKAYYNHTVRIECKPDEDDISKGEKVHIAKINYHVLPAFSAHQIKTADDYPTMADLNTHPSWKSLYGVL